MVNAALTALEYIGESSKTSGRRHRIEHCGECPDAYLERIRKLGAIIVTQPPFIYYNGERYLATVEPSQQPYLYRIRSPLRHGIIVAGSSDTPVVPNNPLTGIQAAVTRRAESGRYLLPDEAVSPELALSLYTSIAAHASFEEHIKGSITPASSPTSSSSAPIPPPSIRRPSRTLKWT
jgi:predicted amidohydrolase YtcJ